MARPRKYGNREFNGRVQRITTRGGRAEAQADEARAVVMAQPHRSVLPKDQRIDHRAECEFGMLSIIGPDFGGIDRMEYEAGVMWRELVGRYRWSISSPKPTPASIANMLPLPPDVHGADIDEKRTRAIRAEYNSAFEAMAGDRRALMTVNDVCIHDKPFRRRPDQIGQIARGTTEDLRRGLRRLAAHFGLDGRRKSR